MSVNDYLTNLSSSIKDTHFEQPQMFSDYYIEDASYFRMDNITAAYNFNALKLFNGNIKLRIYSSIQNAFVITGYEGLDPEVSDGLDYNRYPRPRTYIFGIQANF
jgi:iron complex outermembrane receptor protein